MNSKFHLQRTCQQLVQQFDQISAERQMQLLLLSSYITRKLKVDETPKLIVICTHNSRRSHIGQLWLAAAADYYNLPTIQTFSGGTEATAFNDRAVKALQKIGFEIVAGTESIENLTYRIRWKDNMKPLLAFSKKYDHKVNPKAKFAAIMVCSEADADCPVVFGADFRLSLPYDDPKAFDETDLEAFKYEERVLQIGREMLFALSKIEQT